MTQCERAVKKSIRHTYTADMWILAGVTQNSNAAVNAALLSRNTIHPSLDNGNESVVGIQRVVPM
jgi:hypothetical protein